MTRPTPPGWQTSHQQRLVVELDRIRHALERTKTASIDADIGDATLGPGALDVIAALFGLSAFETDVLLLCAGVEMDARFSALCAQANGDPSRAYPTFSLALATLAEPHWSALSPEAPLRRWRLVGLSGGPPVVLSPLRISERILHYLAGLDVADQALQGVAWPAPAPATLVASQRLVAERIVSLWSDPATPHPLPLIQLNGDDGSAKRAIAAAACAQLGLRLAVIPADLLPTNPAELAWISRLVEREAALSRVLTKVFRWKVVRK